jgi:hypothetical protein
MSAISAAVFESVNALDLASRMGISLDTLSRAIGADPNGLNSNPRGSIFQPGLKAIADLWEDIVIMSGDEEHARLFLGYPRPDLRGNPPIYYLEHGRPNVVRSLVFAMREMLP